MDSSEDHRNWEAWKLKTLGVGRTVWMGLLVGVMASVMAGSLTAHLASVLGRRNQELSQANLSLAKQLEEKNRLHAELSDLQRDFADAWTEVNYLSGAKIGRLQQMLTGKITGLTGSEERRLAATIFDEAAENNLDPLLVLALMKVESGFDNFAVSPKGDGGLMQLNPRTAAWLARREGLRLAGDLSLFNPELNVRLGIRYLGRLRLRYGDLHLALAAYNYGPERLKQKRANPLTPEASAFVGQVFKAYHRFVAQEARIVAAASNGRAAG